MIRLIKIGVMLGLVWSLYWYGAGYALRHSITNWFQTQEANGWQADFADINTSGYPLRHITELTSPALADPVNGTAWQAEWLHLDSPAIWPGQQTLRFAHTPQRLSYFDQTAVVTAEDMVATLDLKPGIALALNQMALTAGRWVVSGENGPLIGATSLNMAMIQTDQPETYQFDVDAQQFTPGERLRRLMRSNDQIPPSFETLTLDMTVRFDHQWDRSALEQRRPQPVAIDLKLAEMHWGALRVLTAAKMTIDANGVPTGTVTLKAENWREMLAMAQASGAIAPQAVGPTEKVLNTLAGLGGNPNALDVTLTLRDGIIAFGILPLGPAPRIFLR